MKIKIVYSILLALFFIGCDSKPQQAQEVKSENINYRETAKKIVSYTLTTTKGEKIDLELTDGVLSSKQFKNKMVLVNFWAPWCKPCVKEMPSFVDLQEKYKDDFVILGVAYDTKTTPENLAIFMEKFKMNFPVTVGEENFRLARDFDDVKMIPESFFYSKEGLFIKKFVGEISHKVLEEYITQGK
ncbi:MAG: TlpA disulfide reductase family protein [Arcobacteraceae bacterium]